MAQRIIDDEIDIDLDISRTRKFQKLIFLHFFTEPFRMDFSLFIKINNSYFNGLRSSITAFYSDKQKQKSSCKSLQNSYEKQQLIK